MFNRIFWPILILLTILVGLTSPPVLSMLPSAVTSTPIPTIQPSPTPTATATPDPFAGIPTITPVAAEKPFIQSLPAVR